MYISENGRKHNLIINVPKSAMMAHCYFKVTKLYYKKNDKLKIEMQTNRLLLIYVPRAIMCTFFSFVITIRISNNINSIKMFRLYVLRTVCTAFTLLFQTEEASNGHKY